MDYGPPKYSFEGEDSPGSIRRGSTTMRLLPSTTEVDAYPNPSVSPIVLPLFTNTATRVAEAEKEKEKEEAPANITSRDAPPAYAFTSASKTGTGAVADLFEQARQALNKPSEKKKEKHDQKIDQNIPRKAVKHHEVSANDHYNKQNSDLPDINDSPSPLQRTYQPLYGSRPQSRAQSIVDSAPTFPPPNNDASPYFYRPSSRASHSPTRSWSPTRTSADYARPPETFPYEPADIDGSPRPGSPSSKYSNVKSNSAGARPLPPAPLFGGPRPTSSGSDASSTSMTDEDTPALVAIPIPEEEEDPFNDQRPDLAQRDSYMTQSTFTDEYNEKDYGEKDYGNYDELPEGKQERRGARDAQMAKKEVKLINGELVLECKIPTILHSFLPRKDSVEFTHMRYTAVTCDPNDYVDRGYKLRQNITSRETELFIAVTMYNENELDFTRTMHGVMRNIAHFCSRTKSRTWGKDGWKKIVVCVIADGRKKVHPRTLDALAALGCYQDGIAKNLVNQREVQAHVYEYTTQVSLDPELKFKGAEKGIVPCQMIFCMKEKNAKKLNSHRWFFNAFGRALNPNVCILLDVGTRPGDNSLYHLWKAFDNDSNVAGAAGEIKAGKGKAWLGLFNPLVASQNFEYKMSNILDKPLESVFGYITVLPGALSAYRYHALQNDESGHGPLSQYFKGETLHGQDADVFTANMYLAEDRILCWELVAKRNESWVLKYVKAATGETDVPDAVPEFISQRRRWLNGAFFAAVYSLLHFRQIWQTSHTPMRKLLLHIEFVYQFIQLLFTYFSLANFYLVFYFIAGSLTATDVDPTGDVNLCKYLFYILRYVLVLTIAMNFILSMGNRPQGAKKMFMGSMVVYGIIMAYVTFASVWIVVKDFESGDMTIGNNIFTNFIVSTLSTIGLYFLMSFLYLDPWHMFTSAGQYFAMLPSYVCTLQIYAFCNAHDISWGTKGDNTVSTDLGAANTSKGGTVELEMPSEQLDIDSGYDTALRNLRDRIEVPDSPPSATQMQEDYYRGVRTYMVTLWMFCNAILAMAVSEAYGTSGISDNRYLQFILWSVAMLALFRAIGSSTFLVINMAHHIMEGKMKFKNRGSGGGSSSKGSSSKKSGFGMPSWISDSGSWLSSKVSSVTPSSMGSVFGK